MIHADLGHAISLLVTKVTVAARLAYGHSICPSFSRRANRVMRSLSCELFRPEFVIQNKTEQNRATELVCCFCFFPFEACVILRPHGNELF